MAETKDIPTRAINPKAPVVKERLPFAQTAAYEQTVVDAGAAAIPPVLPTRRYTDRDLIGRGGMGEVRLCHDGTVGRDVAMKIIRTDGGGLSQEQLGRFLREARIQGQLEHPASVPVYDLGVDDRGELFFTMKRVRGTSLESVFEHLASGDVAFEKQYSRRKLLSAFVQVCMAVDFAHRRGVLHRDLKPANIMLGDFGEVYILDWGIAKIMHDADAGVAASTSGIDLEQTAVGTLVGSPGYMSPEQCRGDGSELTSASDTYSLGAILYEILTLTRMHEASSVMKLLVMTIENKVIPPSERAPEREIPPELDRVCLRAVATNPKERFESARALSDEIEAYLDGDRDLELRRTAARTHATEAREALKRALSNVGDEASERSRAMREVTRALGQDAANPEALDVFLQLLTHAPRVLPPEARAEIQASSVDLQKTASRWGTFAFLGFGLNLPVLFWMGIRTWWLVAIQAAAIAISAYGNWRLTKGTQTTAGAPTIVLIASHIALCILSLTLGPLIVAPIVALANMLGLVLASDRTRRVLSIVLGCLSLVLPLGLQLAGVLPTMYTFEHDTLVVHSFMYHLPMVPTLTFMASLSVAIIAVTGVVGGAYRDALFDAQTRVRLQLWQLRQMAPDLSKTSATS